MPIDDAISRIGFMVAACAISMSLNNVAPFNLFHFLKKDYYALGLFQQHLKHNN